MKVADATVGTRVRVNVKFPAVAKGTEGVIDEDYGTGVMVAWDAPVGRLPPGYSAYDGKPAVATGIVRDGFDKETELKYLDVV